MKRLVSDTPIHDAFGLSYANYLVYPRSVLERMPVKWQAKLVQMFNELHDRLDYEAPDYSVHARIGGKFVKDPLREYRRPDRSLIKETRQP